MLDVVVTKNLPYNDRALRKVCTQFIKQGLTFGIMPEPDGQCSIWREALGDEYPRELFSYGAIISRKKRSEDDSVAYFVKGKLTSQDAGLTLFNKRFAALMRSLQRAQRKELKS